MSLFASSPSELRAILALIVHEGHLADRGETQYALTSHPVEEAPSGVVLGPGQCLAHADHQALLRVLLNTTTHDNEYLPADVLSHSGAQLAWYIPGCVRRMWFRSGHHTEHWDVPWPTLVF